MIVKPGAPLSGVEQRIWELIEQSLLPSEREDTYQEYVSVLAAVWGYGRDAGYDDATREPVGLANGGYHRNPYDGSDPS